MSNKIILIIILIIICSNREIDSLEEIAENLEEQFNKINYNEVIYKNDLYEFIFNQQNGNFFYERKIFNYNDLSINFINPQLIIPILLTIKINQEKQFFIVNQLFSYDYIIKEKDRVLFFIKFNNIKIYNAYIDNTYEMKVDVNYTEIQYGNINYSNDLYDILYENIMTQKNIKKYLIENVFDKFNDIITIYPESDSIGYYKSLKAYLIRSLFYIQFEFEDIKYTNLKCDEIKYNSLIRLNGEGTIFYDYYFKFLISDGNGNMPLSQIIIFDQTTFYTNRTISFGDIKMVSSTDFIPVFYEIIERAAVNEFLFIAK